jgi:uncharacterized membrane protein
MNQVAQNDGPWRPADGVAETRPATFGDLRMALRKGLADFRRAPWIGMSVGALYALGGVRLIWLVELREYRGLTFPLIAGFALIGPFACTILYEISRRIEQGQRFDWDEIPGMIVRTARKQILYHGFVLMFWLAVWSRIGLVIYYAHFGLNPAPFWDVVTTMLFTPVGLSFLLWGHSFGALFAFISFSISVLAFPFLLDRDADFITAIVTSFQAVLKSPVVMISWGVLIGIILAVASFPMFLGLLFALPILGHTSWHLYRIVLVE